VAEEVVEEIRLDEVIELVATTHPHGDRKPPLGEMREKVGLRDKTGDADHFEARETLQPFTRLFQHRDAVAVDA
jgi:hypothetical protein